MFKWFTRTYIGTLFFKIAGKVSNIEYKNGELKNEERIDINKKRKEIVLG